MTDNNLLNDTITFGVTEPPAPQEETLPPTDAPGNPPVTEYSEPLWHTYLAMGVLLLIVLCGYYSLVHYERRHLRDGKRKKTWQCSYG
jgi:hypothetical protein